MHSSDFGEGNTQTATTVTQHWVVLSERSYTALDSLERYTHLLSHGLLSSNIVGNELVQGRIEQTDVYGQTVHCLEDALEVSLLVRQQLSKSLLTSGNAVGENHLTHSDDLLVLEEHVFSTGQTDTLGTELASHLCIVWSISIGTNLQLGVLVAEVHQLLEVARELSSLGGNLASVNLTSGTVQRDVVTLLIYNAVNLNSLVLIANVQSTYTRYAALTHTTSHNGSVRGHTTTSSQDTLGSCHTGQVLRRGLDTYKHYLVTILVPLLSIVSVEYNLTAGCTRRCRQTLSNHLGSREGLLIEYGVQQLIELLRLAAHDGGLLVNHTLMEQVDGDLHHGSTCTLTVTSLEEPELALLNGELHILHVVIVVLQFFLDTIQLGINLRHSLLH